MLVGGLQKFSLLDFPEHVSAIIFTQGCNFRCQYCYNPMLVRPVGNSKPKKNSEEFLEKGHSLISENDLFSFLESRAGKLDAVVITGGEPTIHDDLPAFIRRIRRLGLKIKLDTNGTSPEMLESLLAERLLDYIAMDVKGSAGKYNIIAGVKVDLEKIKESITIIMKSGLPYEFRTTLVPDLIMPAEIRSIGKQVKGADKWYLQVFKTDIDLVNQSFKNTKSYTAKQMEEMKLTAGEYVKYCEVR